MSAADRTGPPTAQAGLDVRVIFDRWVYRTPEEMRAAALVAEVVVAGHGSSRWTTPNGTRPPVAHERDVVRGGYVIYTPVHFSQMCVYTDRRSEHEKAEPVYATLGGQVGPDRYRAEGFPHLEQLSERWSR